MRLTGMILGLALAMACGVAQATVPCALGQFRDDLRACLQERSANSALMQRAIRNSNSSQLMSGFRMCMRRDEGGLFNGNACYKADPSSPLRMARMGAP